MCTVDPECNFEDRNILYGFSRHSAFLPRMAARDALMFLRWQFATLFGTDAVSGGKIRPTARSASRYF